MTPLKMRLVLGTEQILTHKQSIPTETASLLALQCTIETFIHQVHIMLSFHFLASRHEPFYYYLSRSNDYHTA